jgi:hypothetical protein
VDIAGYIPALAERAKRTRSWIARSTRSLALGTTVSAASRGEK